MNNDLTIFQIQCQELLSAALEQKGKRIVEKKIQGHPLPFIMGKVDGYDLTYKIYADGADFKTPGSHYIFEKQDFESLQELAKEFAVSILKETKHK